MLAELLELETRLRSTFGASNHYQLRLWQRCHSIQAAGIEERVRIAQEVLRTEHRGEWIWALGGWHMLLGQVQARLNDADPHVRSDAIVALTDFGPHARGAVPLLLDRLRSGTLHERTLAAWALPRIGASNDVVPILLNVLDEAAAQSDAGELRLCLVQAIEQLTDSFRVRVPLARRCLSDRFWKCRLRGVRFVERLIRRERRLLPMLVPNVEELLLDEVVEVQEAARQFVSQNC